MKNKWLLILFIIFLGVIVLSLLITQQSQKALSLTEKEISIVEQTESKILSAGSSAPVRQTLIKPLPLVRSGITIIKAPLSPSEEKSMHVSQTADQAANNVSGRNLVASSASDVQAQDSLQTGITKTGKQPTPKEAQEMNSSGIILY
jgi:uncharacterized membrane protein